MAKKSMAFGTFDIFHKGHENFLKQARQCGDCLIVVVARDKTVAKVKGNLPQNNEQARLQAVVESGLADKVVLGNIKDKYKVIERFKPDVICLGYDQKAFTESLKSELQEFGLSKTRIIRLKSYKEEKYKSSRFKIIHTSVGAIIRFKRGATNAAHTNNKDDKILMIDRAAFPCGWACPAGHVDENETPEQALDREAKEEVNLDVIKYKLLIHEYVDWNECVKGVKGHDWYVYEVLKWSGEVKRSERETKNIGWFSPDEIKRLQLEKIWKYWFEKLNII